MLQRFIPFLLQKKKVNKIFGNKILEMFFVGPQEQ